MLANEDTVPINFFAEKIFREVYGINPNMLYTDKNFCQKIREAIIEVRKSYQSSNACETKYHTEELRKAYMIAYYPYYIEPIRRIIRKHIIPHFDNVGNVCVDCFAGGPCPEILGLLQAYSDVYYISFDVCVYDSEAEWESYQNMTKRLCNEIKLGRETVNWKFMRNFDILKTINLIDFFSYRWQHKTDIFLLQNYLSHLDYSQADIFLKWFEKLVSFMKAGAFFVCVDLNYDTPKKILTKMADLNFLLRTGLKVIGMWLPTKGKPLSVKHGNQPKPLRDKIFNGENKLIPKTYTNYYYVVLQKYKQPF